MPHVALLPFSNEKVGVPLLNCTASLIEAQYQLKTYSNTRVAAQIHVTTLHNCVGPSNDNHL